MNFKLQTVKNASGFLLFSLRVMRNLGDASGMEKSAGTTPITPGIDFPFYTSATSSYGEKSRAFALFPLRVYVHSSSLAPAFNYE
jgi:hypothetical protein